MTMRSLHRGSPARATSSRRNRHAERHLGLEAGEVGPEAVVDAGAELQVVAGVGAVDVHGSASSHRAGSRLAAPTPA